MKKILCSIAAALLLLASAHADEGMWLLPLLEQLNIKDMQKLGCRLSADQIYSINHSSIKDAIVIFGGGCTGEIISDKGLLVTNHHCGYSSIQQLSSDEHNYLENGFWAMNNKEEIPAPGLSVTFLVSMQDVTDAVFRQFGGRVAADEAGRFPVHTHTVTASLSRNRSSLRARSRCCARTGFATLRSSVCRSMRRNVLKPFSGLRGKWSTERKRRFDLKQSKKEKKDEN